MNKTHITRKKKLKRIWWPYIYFIYMQMTRDYKLCIHRSSHCKKAKIQIFEGCSPLNVGNWLCRFRHQHIVHVLISGRSGLCSNDQLEPGSQCLRSEVYLHIQDPLGMNITSSHWHALQPTNHKPLITEVNVRHPCSYNDNNSFNSW